MFFCERTTRKRTKWRRRILSTRTTGNLYTNANVYLTSPFYAVLTKYIKAVENEMARPKPKILMEFTDPKSYRSEQILAADAIYAVFHDDKPINLRSLNSLVNFPGPKYKKVSFSNSGHAFNLAKKLNTLFNTTEFTVVKLTQGETVSEK